MTTSAADRLAVLMSTHGLVYNGEYDDEEDEDGEEEERLVLGDMQDGGVVVDPQPKKLEMPEEQEETAVPVEAAKTNGPQVKSGQSTGSEKERNKTRDKSGIDNSWAWEGELEAFEETRAGSQAALGQSRSGHPDRSQWALGRLAPVGERFCPVAAIAKFPYKYVRNSVRDLVADDFFTRGKVYERKWEIYYLHPPSGINTKPLLLMPCAHVLKFLNKISKELDTRVNLPFDSAKQGLIIDFEEDDGTPRPRFLGMTTSHEDFKILGEMIPNNRYKPPEESERSISPSAEALAAFRQKFEAGMQSSKNKSRSSKKKRQEDRVTRQQAWGKQVKRLQRYLALPLRDEADQAHLFQPGEEVPPAVKENNQSTEQSALGHLQRERASLYSRAHVLVDPNRAVTRPFSESVVFIAVDVESYEHHHGSITEVGVATLDTNDLIGEAPGLGGSNWISKICARHFRIKENAHLVNHTFVTGCAERFDFGQSEWISQEEAPRVIASCFRPPFGRSNIDILTKSNLPGLAEGEKRKLVLVGHDLAQDVSYLHTLGYSPYSLSNLYDTLDTSAMYRWVQRESQARSLGTLLYDLYLSGWNLHNAGNDAVYTLQAMIGMAFKGLSVRLKTRAEKDKAKWNRTRQAVNTALDTAQDDNDGWSTGDASDDPDGGPGVLQERDDVPVKKPTPKQNVSMLLSEPD